MEKASFLRPSGGIQGRLFRRLIKGMDQHPEIPPGTKIGKYRVERELARGGSSVVYRAERDDGVFAQTVALKVGCGGASWGALVRRERNILGQLNHAGISRILDAGETDCGLPWLAMEFVEGEPIDQWCRTSGLAWQQVLTLIIAACSAVQHAHSRLVLHRDLKPDNILVDGGGNIRLLDFGISTTLDGSREASRGFTPGFGSPEQCRGDLPTTADDIYALGRLISKLTLSKADGQAASVADTRMPFVTRASLEAIVGRATHADPGARYQTVSELASDLGLLIGDKPAIGVEVSWVIRLLLFLRRRWVPTAVGVLGALSVSVVLIAATGKIAKERDAALQEEQRTREVVRFFIEIFDAPASHDPPANQVLDRARERATRERNVKPEVRGAVLDGLGMAYYYSGRYHDASEMLSRAIEVRRDLGPKAKILVAESLANLALVNAYLSEPESVSSLLREVEDLLDGYDVDSPLVRFRVETLVAQVAATIGDHRRAGEALKAAISTSQHHFGAGSPEHVEAMRRHARWRLGRLEGRSALDELKKCTAAMARIYGHDDPRVLSEMTYLRSVEAEMGGRKEAEDYFRGVLLRPDVFDGDRLQRKHAAQFYLARALQLQGRYAEAARYYDGALVTLENADNGKSGPHFAADAQYVAQFYADKGDLDRAELIARKALRAAQISVAPNGVEIARNQYSLGRIRAMQGDVYESLGLAWQAYERMRRVYGPRAIRTAEVDALIGEILRKRGDSNEAKVHLLRARAALHGDRVFDYAVLRAGIDTSLSEMALAKGRVSEATAARLLAKEWLANAFGQSHPLVTSVQLIGPEQTHFEK
ncbi:serine/threonine-protein kinase [Agrilutibacter solisilvae]|uniref:Serine/threonine protein kinase n=1 Tax=Agrilutibacter solisilvae TaxID=2763317 RepID=A0A975AR32_9GAMM|nr:serine/threonine-protein kinase [Lysobacter solisilvae]QSX77509.1 serine/threonine protein kinase [Lysobacter solisilvae]